jgi:hypothetical protein
MNPPEAFVRMSASPMRQLVWGAIASSQDEEVLCGRRSGRVEAGAGGMGLGGSRLYDARTFFRHFHDGFEG